MLTDESGLLAHQRSVVSRLQDQPSKLIMWDMGSGKSAAAAAIDRDIRQNLDEGTRGATLIVCPKSVLGVWRHWLSWARIPDDSVFVIDPTDREPFQQALWEHVASKGASRETWFVCHWDAIPKLNFTRAGTKTRPMKFTHIIGDEIHRISGRKTRRTTAFKQIKAQYKTGLSGTPSDDKIQDLWSVLHWLQPGVWTSYIRFCRSYLQWVVPEPEKGYWIVTGTKNLADLRARIADFSDRVRLDEVTDLPAKTYTTLTVDLGPAQRRPYNQMRDDLLADVGEGGRNTLLSPQQVNAQQRLQQLALSALDVDEDTDRVFAVEPSAKLDALVELLLDHPDEQFVVFCQFVDVLHLVAQRLRRARIPASSVPFTGALLRPNRDRQVSDFQGGETRVIYGTIGAMGTGITLTAARAVVFLDRSDKPNENEQAENRAHRIGQQGTVQVIDLVARDTVDESRVENIAEKGDRLEELYGD